MILARRGDFDALKQLLSDAMKVTFIRELDITFGMFTAEIRKFTRRFGDRIELEWADSRAQDQINVWAESLDRRRIEKIGRLASEGLSPNEAATKLRRDLQDLTNAEIETIFRTQSQMAFQAARFQSDQDEVWGYKYVTMGDNRVRDEHAQLDGVVRQKDDPFWDTYWPPNGWNCRCQVVSIFNKRRQTRVPSGAASPDEGFQFNPGRVLNGPS